MYVAHVGPKGLERDCHSLGGPGTPPMSFTVKSQLHMDPTTSRLLSSGSRGLLSSSWSHSRYRHEYIHGPGLCLPPTMAYISPNWCSNREFVTRVAKLSSSWMSAKRRCLPMQGVALSELTSHTDWVNERYSRYTAHSRASRKVAGQLKSPWLSGNVTTLEEKAQLVLVQRKLDPLATSIHQVLCP